MLVLILLAVPYLQWHNVTNTVWWQDFPRSITPDYLSLFRSSFGENNHDLKSDFGAQLAGFMASLVIDVPSQAHWILELAMYSFKGAHVHLIASVPGIYSPKSPYMSQSRYYLSVSIVVLFVWDYADLVLHIR